MSTLPNFLFIGGDRCGSKTLHKIFRQHPQCYVPIIADPYFFDRNYERGLGWYSALFKEAPPSAVAVGEFSHDYIHSALAAERISRDLPGVRLLATLRHPVERTYSSYASAVAAGVIRGSFEQALEAHDWLIGNSLYGDKLDTFSRYFNSERLKVLIFDDLVADPMAFARRAFDFLGLPFAESIDYHGKMSQLSTPRFPMAGAISKFAANTLRRLGWVEVLGHFKSRPAIQRVFYRPIPPEARPRIKGSTRRALLEIFAPHIARVEEYTQRDLRAWWV